MGIPYIRVHFINDQCAIFGADILNIGDYSARSPLSFLGSRWFCHIYVSTYEIFWWSRYHMGFPDRGPFDLNLVGTLNIM